MYEMMGRSERQASNKQNVQAVMMPMSQLVGGWHVTSMTGHQDNNDQSHVPYS